MDMQNFANAAAFGSGEFSSWFNRDEQALVPRYHAVKRGLDLALGAALLVVLAPVMFMIWAIVKLDGGPGFYAHRRVGLNYQPFPCLKFRTMRVDADRALRQLLARDPAAAREWRLTRKLTRDPRITRIGRILRSTSLDELPQLLNVMRGQMSLVGPRPVVLSELLDFYGVDKRAAYVSVRPGLTGLWQVSGRSDANYAQRTEFDARYARQMSFKTDLWILLRTVSVVLGRAGAY